MAEAATAGRGHWEVDRGEMSHVLERVAQGDLMAAAPLQRQLHQMGFDPLRSTCLLGRIALELNQAAAAVHLGFQVVQEEPASAEGHYVMGRGLEAQGRFNESEASLRQALALHADNAETCYALGNVLKARGLVDDAIQYYRRALALQPAFAAALNNMGNALRDLGRGQEAAEAFAAALDIDPNLTEALRNLGGVLHQQGALERAAALFEQMTAGPEAAAADYLSLGNVRKDQGLSDQAVAAYEQALSLDPGQASAHNNLAVLYKERGEIERARVCYDQSLAWQPRSLAVMNRALLMPVIPDSAAQIAGLRQRLETALDHIRTTAPPVFSPYTPTGATAFHLAYHGLDNRRLQEKIAAAYRRLDPDLNWRGGREAPRTTGRLKVGLVSHFFRRHTIGYLFEGVIRHLARDHFEVTVFRFPGAADAVSASIDQAADHTVVLPPNVPAARRIVAAAELDILFYADIGMEPLTYFLAHGRLAPIQCTGWGHPDTTGLPHMDYYLSYDRAEPAGAEAHYSEQLIRLDRFVMFCHRPPAPPVRQRPDLDLPADRHLYVCPQSLFKVHPDFDRLVAAILSADPDGMLLFFEGKHPGWRRQLTARLARHDPKSVHRIRFLPRLGESDFLSVLRLADAVLDTIHFTGGYTSLLALGLGVPVVTWPGAFMRGRLTTALYAQVGVEELVARDAASYVRLALRLAHDRSWKRSLNEKLQNQAAVLFEDHVAVRSLERFFLHAAGR